MKTYRVMLPALFVLASSVGVAFGSAASSTTHLRTHGLSAPSTPAVTHWGKPIFVDNFQGRKLNLKNWAVYNDPNPSRKPVPRRAKSSVKVRRGSLELIGHYQKPYGDVGGGISYNVNQTYGRWVVRFRAAIGAGYGPVILLWPQNNKDWPADGEIDLAEIFDAGRQGLHENLHIGAANHHVGNWIGSVNATKWHTLAVDWLPDHITFWIDGKPEWRITPTSYPYNYIPDTPFHLALQLDQGCDGNCKAGKNTHKRVIMQVNWVKIYAAPGNQPVATLPEPDRASVRGVAYSPDGKSLATTDVNGHAYSWSQPADQRTSALTDPNSKGATSIAFSPDGSALAVGDNNGHAYLSEPPAFGPFSGTSRQAITSVAFTTRSHYLAGGDANGNTYIWTVATRKILTTLSDPAGAGVHAVAYSPDGNLLATGDSSGHVYLWALPDYKLQATLTDPDSRSVRALAFTTASHDLAAADASGHVYVWDAATGQILATLQDPGQEAVHALAYSPEGKLLATGDANGHVLTWALPDYKLQTTLTDPDSQGVTSLSFSPDSARLAAGDADGKTYIYPASG